VLVIEKYKVILPISVKEAVTQMDRGGIGFCVCINSNDKVVGIFSNGDFRRGVLNGCDLNDNVEKIINNDFIYVSSDYDQKEVNRIFSDNKVQHIPVIDKGTLVDIITKELIFGLEMDENQELLNCPVVIMAGGKGKRLDPFTRILPKPLIPLGEDPVIKVIMDGFRKFAINDFFISLNNKGRMVKAYFHDHESNYHITYIEEDKPLGTAGALKFLKDKIDVPFFVTNCDIIIKANYQSIYEFHKNGSYDLTLVGSMQHHIIPYGVCEIDNGGILKELREKPDYSFLVNTGLYVLNPVLLDLIPTNTYFDMTELIQKVQENNMKVGVFPVSEGAWNDVGQWHEFEKANMSLKWTPSQGQYFL
jgi:dTDP-glucose pyrophosphorylase